MFHTQNLFWCKFDGILGNWKNYGKELWNVLRQGGNEERYETPQTEWQCPEEYSPLCIYMYLNIYNITAYYDVALTMQAVYI